MSSVHTIGNILHGCTIAKQELLPILCPYLVGSQVQDLHVRVVLRDGQDVGQHLGG